MESLQDQMKNLEALNSGLQRENLSLTTKLRDLEGQVGGMQANQDVEIKSMQEHLNDIQSRLEDKVARGKKKVEQQTLRMEELKARENELQAALENDRIKSADLDHQARQQEQQIRLLQSEVSYVRGRCHDVSYLKQNENNSFLTCRIMLTTEI